MTNKKSCVCVVGLRSLVLWILSASLLLPFCDFGFLREHLTMYFKTFLIPSVNLLMLFATSILILIAIIMRIQLSNRMRRILLVSLAGNLIFSCIIVISAIFQEIDIILVLGHFLYIMPSFYYAILIFSLIREPELQTFMERFILLFSILMIANLIFWYTNINTQYVANDLSYFRMSAPGASSIILGYTVIMLLSMLKYTFNSYTIFTRCFVFIIFVLVIIATGARGAIWWLPLIIVMELPSNKTRILCFVLVACLIFIYVDAIEQDAQRLLVFEDSLRTLNAIAAMEFWGNYNFGQLLFGGGFGNIYPFQQFLLYGGMTDVNVSLGDFNALAQPHNTYLYLLVETGLFGTVSYLISLIATIYILGKHLIFSLSKKFSICITFIIIVVLNCLDSVLVVSAGVASIWWFCIFYLNIILDYKESQECNY